MDLPNPGIELGSPALQANSLVSELPEKPKNTRVGSLSLLIIALKNNLTWKNVKIQKFREYYNQLAINSDQLMAFLV